MAFLPPEPFTLTGGCFCKANRYTIRIPALDERSLIPNALETPIAIDAHGKIQTLPTRFPLVDIDHCDSCRRTSGVVVQCWFICPTSWVTFDLLPSARDKDSSGLALDLNEKSQHSNDSTVPYASAIQTGTITQVPAIQAVGPAHPQQECEGIKFYPKTTKQADLLHNTFLSHYNSSSNVTRTFCSRCGTNLTYFMDRPASVPIPPTVDITVGSLDADCIRHIRPDRHAWWDEAVAWVGQLFKRGDGGFLIRHPGGNIGLQVTD